MSEPKFSAISQSEETRAVLFQDTPFNIRFAYARSADSFHNNDFGQDYIAFSTDSSRLAFALCDGVSQSFFGDLAARILGAELVRWMVRLDTAMIADHSAAPALEACLQELTVQASDEVANIRYSEDMSGMLQVVLEKKRAIGSESTFVAGVIDFQEEWFAFAWMGDTRLRIWDGASEQTTLLGETFHTRERWSSKKGLVGSLHFYHDRLANLKHFMVYSDGLARLDKAIQGKSCSNQAIDAFIAEAGQQPNSDDTCLFEWWDNPPQFDLQPAAPNGLTGKEEDGWLWLTWSAVADAARYEVSLRGAEQEILETIYTETLNCKFSSEVMAKGAQGVCVRGWKNDEPGHWTCKSFRNSDSQVIIPESQPSPQPQDSQPNELSMAVPLSAPPVGTSLGNHTVTAPPTLPAKDWKSKDAPAKMAPVLGKKTYREDETRPTNSLEVQQQVQKDPKKRSRLALISVFVLAVVGGMLFFLYNTDHNQREAAAALTAVAAQALVAPTAQATSTYTITPDPTPALTATVIVTESASSTEETSVSPVVEDLATEIPELTEAVLSPAETTASPELDQPVLSPTVDPAASTAANPAEAKLITKENLQSMHQSLAVTLTGPDPSSNGLLVPSTILLAAPPDNPTSLLALASFTTSAGNAYYLYEINLSAPDSWKFLQEFPSFRSVAFNGQTIAGVYKTGTPEADVLGVWERSGDRWEEIEGFKTKPVPADQICALAYDNNDLYVLNRIEKLVVYKDNNVENPRQLQEEIVNKMKATNCTLTVDEDALNAGQRRLAMSFDKEFRYGFISEEAVEFTKSTNTSDPVDTLIDADKLWWIGATNTIYFHDPEGKNYIKPLALSPYAHFTIIRDQSLLIVLPAQERFPVYSIDYSLYDPKTKDGVSIQNIDNLPWKTSDRVYFTPDGKYLYAISADGVNVWFTVVD